MLEIFHLKANDYKVQPWKNGLGSTREIAIDNEQPFRWRLSWATIPRSGPFSLYPDYDRTLVILHGQPVQLTHDGKRHKTIGEFMAYSFSGEFNTEATVSSLAEDFNLFTLRGKTRANIYPTRVSAKEEIQFPIAGQEHFIFCIDGSVEVSDPNTGTKAQLEQKETFRLSRKSKQEYLNLKMIGIAPSSRCLWIVAHLL